MATAASALACNLTGLISPSPTPPPEPASAPTPEATPSPVDQPHAAAPATPTEATSPPLAPAPDLPFPPLIIDAHEDIAWNWFEFGRDPAESALDTRAREAGTGIPASVGQRVAGLPQWLEGRIGIVFATLYVMPRQYAFSSQQTQVYNNANQAHARAYEQLQRYVEFADQQAQVRLLTTRQELEGVVTTWASPDPEHPPTVGLLISMEGADPIKKPDEVQRWYEWGLRAVGPAWKRTRYAGGTGEAGPLTDLGRELLSEMAGLNMILDLSHIAKEAYLEAVDTYPGPIIASHSNPQRFLPTDRGLSDEMINGLVARDGVVGIVLYNHYLNPKWDEGEPRSDVPIQTVVEAIDYVVQLAGSATHVGLGTDFDGGFGLESIPEGMDSVADLAKIADGLLEWGYSREDVELIMYGNWLRILRSCLP